MRQCKHWHIQPPFIQWFCFKKKKKRISLDTITASNVPTTGAIGKSQKGIRGIWIWLSTFSIFQPFLKTKPANPHLPDCYKKRPICWYFCRKNVRGDHCELLFPQLLFCEVRRIFDILCILVLNVFYLSCYLKV